MLLVHGAKIGYFQGDIRLLMDDLKALKPTVFPVVPRLLNRMFDKVIFVTSTSLHVYLLLSVLYNGCSVRYYVFICFCVDLWTG